MQRKVKSIVRRWIEVGIALLALPDKVRQLFIIHVGVKLYITH